MHPLGGHGPLVWVLFSENVCDNERIGSHRGGRAPANGLFCMRLPVSSYACYLV